MLRQQRCADAVSTFAALAKTIAEYARRNAICKARATFDARGL
jgi:hypothetical protein